MSRSLLAAVAASFPLTLGALPALAEGPRVVADIAPVHGLVARVMEGVGEPALLVRPGASPRSGTARPTSPPGPGSPCRRSCWKAGTTRRST